MRTFLAVNTSNFRLCAAILASLSFLITIPVIVIAADSAWRKQDSGTLAQLRTVFFVDQNQGWAAGARGTLLRTNDGGATWEIQSRPGEDSIRDLVFFDRQDGWILCERNIFLMRSVDEVRSYLMHTTNGGSTWERVELAGKESDTRFTRFVLAGTGRAWLLGETGSLYLTTDRGRNWKKQIPPTRYLLLGGVFVDEDHGWLAGGGASIARTIDGGLVWRTAIVRNAPNVRFTAISFGSVDHGWAVGNGGIIFKTGDGGRTWTRQTSGTEADLTDVKFLDRSEGWAVGDDGALLHTRDGGARWLTIDSGTRHPLERLMILDRSHGWVVGFGGTILSLGQAATQPPVLRRD